MSSFLSRKYLELRNAQQRATTIEHDQFCVACGYNVRGLRFGQNCPECGAMIKFASTHVDPLLSGDEMQRQRTRVGLALIAACLFIASIAGLLLFIFASLLGHPYASDAYLWLGLGLCGLWIVGVWLLTHQNFRAHVGQFNWMRLMARWTSLLWLPGHLAWMAATMWLAGTAAGDSLLGWSFLIRVTAGISGLVFAAWLLQLANGAELDDAAKHINLAIWMLPLPTLMLALLPDQVQWIFLAMIGMVLLMWCWFMAMMGRGVLIMQRHVSWGVRAASEAAYRDSRIIEKRAELQRDAEAQVRPVSSQPNSEIPVNRRKG